MSWGRPEGILRHFGEWTLFNTLAAACAAFLSLSVVPPAAETLGLAISDRTITALLAILIGLMLALSQWFLVRPHLPRPIRWIPSTLIGWMAPVLLFATLVRPSIEAQRLQVPVLFAALGVSMGVTQYLVLRPVRRTAPVWIVSSAAGWLLLAIVLPVPFSNSLEFIKLGAVPALITGLSYAFIVCLPGREGMGTSHPV